MALFVATYVTFGFSYFVWWLVVGTLWAAIEVLLCCLFALVVMWPLAMTSTNCDGLMTALNASRLKHISTHGTHLAIFTLEIALRRLNLDQGLGFMVDEVVINKRTLKQVFLAMATIFPPIFASVWALREQTLESIAQHDNVESPCLLNTEQTAVLQNLVGIFNASCVYNL
eukprot:COSAG01_NODE_22677_length_845_cov_47.839142_2_plen_170_part_01